MQMKSNSKKASITFLLDESNDTLLAYERIPQDEGGGVSAEILKLSLEEIRGREPDEIQRALGRLVLSFLNLHSHSGLNLPRDMNDEKELDSQYFGNMRSSSKNNSLTSVYEMAVDLIGRGIRNENWNDIEQGELLLNQSVNSGLSEAIRYKEDVWDIIKPRLHQKLNPD
ncbi:hypothetical protein [Delftia acidovorans]|nr:hypothetical protein [Delftia acidovorans]